MIVIYGIVILLMIFIFLDAIKNNLLALIVLIIGFIAGFIIVGGLYGGIGGSLFAIALVCNLSNK